jgi:hypothetical protein
LTKKQTTVLLAILGIVVVLCVVSLAAVLMFIRSIVHQQDADAQAAGTVMSAARATFTGAIPIIEMRPGGPVFTRPVPDAPAPSPLHTMHVLTWDPDERSLSRIDIPFGLLRWNDAPFTIAGRVTGGFSMERVGIHARDLERFGPALLFDQDMPDGTHTLIWTD